MKGLLPIALLLLCHFGFGQSKQDSIITFTDVIQIEGATKEQLFIRARQWFNQSFKDARNVIRVADKETGEVLAKGIIRSQHWYKALGSESKTPVSYFADIEVYVKDGRYKYKLTNFTNTEVGYYIYSGPLTTSKVYPIKGYRSKEIMNRIWVSQQEELSISVGEIIAGLKESMKKPINDF